MKMMKDDDSRVSYNPTFGAALGIPLVVSEDVPEGKVQFWLDGKFVKEVGIEL